MNEMLNGTDRTGGNPSSLSSSAGTIFIRFLSWIGSARRLLYVLSGGVATVLLAGCAQLPLLDPKGPVGLDSRFIIVVSTALMLIVVIPVILMVVTIPGKYRAANRKARYMPRWSHSRAIEWTIWLIPAVIVLILCLLVVQYTFRMDPFKPLPGKAAPLTIEVISLDWKWLFIYPDQDIAAVNQLVFPDNIPLHFRLTSATVMTSFFIPRLGSQIYAMAGMTTHLNLLALERGTYNGQNQQFSGRHYADMNFKARAVSPQAFAAWVQKARQSPMQLDAPALERLAEPSGRYPLTLYSHTAPGIFETVLNRFKPKTAGLIGADPASKALPMRGQAGAGAAMPGKGDPHG